MSSREKLFTHYVVRVRIIPTSIHCILNALVLAPGLSKQTKHPQGRYRRRHETEGESRRAQGGLPPGGLRVRRASCGDTEEAQRSPGTVGIRAGESQAGGQAAGSGGWAGPEVCLDSVLSIAEDMILAAQGHLGTKAGCSERAWWL